MTDRDLLEAAARAIGMPVIPEGGPWPRDEIGWFFNQVGDHPPALYRTKTLIRWAPLDDDGDALRLAVKLSIDVNFRGATVRAYPEIQTEDHISESTACGPAIATRRAIVRAAAAIGGAQ